MNSLIIIITGILGATITYFVSEKLNQGSIRGSALPSLIVGSFFYIFPDIASAYLTFNIPIVFIGASFIGMVSAETKGDLKLLITSGVLFGIIYVNKSDFFDGYGGALGALAFIALLTSMGISVVLSEKMNFYKSKISLRKWFFKQKNE